MCLGLIIDLGKKNADNLGVPIKKVFVMVAHLLEQALDEPDLYSEDIEFTREAIDKLNVTELEALRQGLGSHGTF